MVLYLLCGPAFSGKSTLAVALESRGALRIALDDLVRARGLSPGDGLPVEVWEDASRDACERLQRGAAAGQNVVLDDTLCFRFLRDRYRRVGLESGFAVRLIVVRVHVDEIHRRVAENALLGARGGIRPDVLRAHVESFEWPTPDESPIEVDGTWPIERQLAALDLA